MILFIRNSILLLFLLSAHGRVKAQQEGKELYVGQFAPLFSIKDIDGRFHSIEQYKGQKILLSFYRNTGCPVCNYRFHEIEREQAFFRQNNIVLLSVYESSVENVRAFRDTNQYCQVLLSNPDGALYQLYGVEVNRGKMTRGTLHGAVQKAKEGRKLFGSLKIKQDGQANRIASDFLIDENGNILSVYYGKYLGDRMPLDLIRKLTQ